MTVWAIRSVDTGMWWTGAEWSDSQEEARRYATLAEAEADFDVAIGATYNEVKAVRIV